MAETRSRAAKKRTTRKKAAPRKAAAARKATKRVAKRSVGSAQKAAMAEGREQSRTIRRYLDSIDEGTGSRRRTRRTPEQIQQKLVDITARMPDVNALERVKLAQEKRDLESTLAAMNGTSAKDLEQLENDFIKVVKPYSLRQGISFGAWRDVGVAASVLQKAGVTR